MKRKHVGEQETVKKSKKNDNVSNLKTQDILARIERRLNNPLPPQFANEDRKVLEEYYPNTGAFVFDDNSKKTEIIADYIRENNNRCNEVLYRMQDVDIYNKIPGIWYDVNTTFLCAPIENFPLWRKNLSGLRVLGISKASKLKKLSYREVFDADVLLISQTVFAEIKKPIKDLKDYIRYGIKAVFSVDFRNNKTYDYLLESFGVNLFAFNWKRVFMDNVNMFNLENHIYKFKAITSRYKWLVSFKDFGRNILNREVELDKILNLCQSNHSIMKFLSVVQSQINYNTINIKIQKKLDKSPAQIENVLQKYYQYTMNSSKSSQDMDKVLLQPTAIEDAIVQTFNTKYISLEEWEQKQIYIQKDLNVFSQKQIHNCLYTLYIQIFEFYAQKQDANPILQEILNGFKTFSVTQQQRLLNEIPEHNLSNDIIKIKYVYNSLTKLIKNECSICLEASERLLCVSPCGHIHCVDCILKMTYSNQSIENNKRTQIQCPDCKDVSFLCQQFFIEPQNVKQCIPKMCDETVEYHQPCCNSLTSKIMSAKTLYIEQYIKNNKHQNVMVVCKNNRYKEELYNSHITSFIYIDQYYGQSEKVLLVSQDFISRLIKIKNIDVIIFVEKMKKRTVNLILSMISNTERVIMKHLCIENTIEEK